MIEFRLLQNIIHSILLYLIYANELKLFYPKSQFEELCNIYCTVNGMNLMNEMPASHAAPGNSRKAKQSRAEPRKPSRSSSASPPPRARAACAVRSSCECLCY